MPRGINAYDEARLQGRLWTPQVIQPALGCWLDAGDPSTITYATGVSSWRDKSNRNRHATQATAGSQPPYVPNGPPRVSFTGSALMGTTLDSDTLYDIFFVGKPLAAGTYRTFLHTGTHAAILLNTGNNDLGTFVGAFNQSGTATWPNQVGLCYFRITFQGSVATAFARDGEATITVEGNAITGSASPTIGNTAGGNQPWGDLYEFISITSSNGASTTDPLIHRSKLEGYGAWRWAALGAGDVVGLLPAAHPFKNRPPLIGD